MHSIRRSVLAAVGDDDDDRWLEIERAPALPVRVDTRLHAVDVEHIEGVLERGAEGRQADTLQILQLVRERRQILLPARLRSKRERIARVRIGEMPKKRDAQKDQHVRA